MLTQADPCLIVFLRPKIALALGKDWPITRLSIDNKTFEPVGPHWSGFYDWLRDIRGRVVGVRYHPTEYTDFLLKFVDRLEYAELGQFSDLSLFFGEARTIDPATSEDQNFIYDQVFESQGEYAIAFAKPGFSTEEQAGLSEGGTEWLNPAIVYGSRDS